MSGAVPVYKPMPVAPCGQGGDTHDVVIVGAGPVGLSLALDLVRRGRSVTVLARHAFIASGSKAICFAKRTLDIFDRLGIGERVVDKGVQWNLGKVFHGGSSDPIYTFDLVDVPGQKNPAFVNIQQYYVEEYLIDALAGFEKADIRWGHEVTGLERNGGGVRLTISAPDGSYSLESRFVVACDGNRSTVRDLMGLDFEGRVFEDNFLIADVRFEQQRPAERWFWFDPPWPGASALMHRQPDNVWRLDFQLGWDIDKTEAIKPENVDPFVRGMLGPDAAYEYEWLSVYTFQCRRMERFVHGSVIFAGDAAHLVSPFGARGCNNGIADIDNLGWKLDAVLSGRAGETLLESYNYEAIITADENILNSTRSTDFMTPKTETSRAYRDAVLALARDHAFARPFVNSGRLSMPVSFPESPLNTPDTDDWAGEGVAPGSPPVDAENDGTWLLGQLSERNFNLLSECGRKVAGLHPVTLSSEAAKARYALGPQGAALLRPDGHIAARWKQASREAVANAYARAIAKTEVIA